MAITLRPETREDFNEIRRINIEAFGGEEEANIVEELRQSGEAIISIVAEQDGHLAGHIMFSPVTQIDRNPELRLAGLAPMAVTPKHQKKGIGAALVTEGIIACRDAGYCAIFVLGHPEYYPRFGFTKASGYGIRCQYDAPDEAFMTLELREGCLPGFTGAVKFHEAFDG